MARKNSEKGIKGIKRDIEISAYMMGFSSSLLKKKPSFALCFLRLVFASGKRLAMEEMRNMIIMPNASDKVVIIAGIIRFEFLGKHECAERGNNVERKCFSNLGFREYILNRRFSRG